MVPTIPTEAAAIGAEKVEVGGMEIPTIVAFASYTLFHNFVRLPTVAIPVGLGAAGLPTSVQITAAAGRDATALNVAHQLEQALWPHESRWPADEKD
jgi:Asp-tRNA(Asn)/Glu-tRNA(Gln) amidotransferase A subunit family amidase